MDRTTLTAALKPLERRGFVAVAVDPEDRRSRILTLSRAGKAALAAALPIWKRTHTQLDRLFAKGELDRLRGDLRSLS
jgi:DNA-binding MarR family transcriptional regulator